MNYLHSFISDR